MLKHRNDEQREVVIKAISNSILFLAAFAIMTPTAFAMKKHPLDYVGFDSGVEVPGSAHLFQTPSANMTCTLNRQYLDFKNKKTIDTLRCERNAPQYVGYDLVPTGNPKVVDDPGDVGMPWMTDPTLPYGTWWSNGSIACLSEEKGLTCKKKDGHGFFLSGAGQNFLKQQPKWKKTVRIGRSSINTPLEGLDILSRPFGDPEQEEKPFNSRRRQSPSFLKD